MRNSRNRIENQAGYKVISRYFSHFIRHEKKYIIAIMILLFSVQMLSNLTADKPLFIGSESYYYLSLSEQGIHYNSLVNLISLIPPSLVFLIPLFIAIFSVLILFDLSKNLLDKETTFFFILFLILTPGFILSFVTLSSYASFLLLTLLGFFLISKQNKKLRYLSLLPFILAAFFDLFSALLLLVMQSIYLFNGRDKKDRLPFYAAITTAVLLIFNQLITKIPLLLGPFHRQEIFTSLFSDLGGLSGLGLFLIILSFVGFTDILKKGRFKLLYLLPLLIPAYFFNTDIIFFLAVITSLLAAFGFLKLFEKKWNLLSLKKFTIILLILGILFSTLAYMDRLPESQPLKEDKEVLSWIEENTPENSVVLSVPENTYLIKYFAKRSPVFIFDKGKNKEKAELSKNVFSSLYIQDLFPLLEANDVKFIYINRDMKKELPKDQGFIFLLKNERFKLIHSSGDSEVWVFENEKK